MEYLFAWQSLAVCYNHEPFLRTALDSILAQETGFPFEVLAHDDVPPDGRADFIREYAAAGVLNLTFSRF